MLSERLAIKYGKARGELARSVKFALDNVSNPEDKANLERILRFLQKSPGESDGEECDFFMTYTRLYEERGILPDEIGRHFRRRQNLRDAKDDPEEAGRRVVQLLQATTIIKNSR